MDKNSIIGIVIIAAIFVVFGIVNKPSAEELANQKRVNDSIALATKTTNDSIAIATEIQRKEAELASLRQQQGITVQSSGTVTEDYESTVVNQQADLDPIEFKTIFLENDLIRVCLSEKGGRPCSVELKEYVTHDSLPVFLFDADSSNFGLSYYQNTQSVHTENLYFKANTEREVIRAGNSSNSVAFRYTPEEGKYIEFAYSLEPGKYQVDLQITFKNMEDIQTRSSGIIDLDWMINSPQQEKGRSNEMIYTTLYYKPYEADVDYFNARTKKDIQTEDFTTKVEWIAYKDQFFSSVLMAEEPFLDAIMKAEIKSESSQYMKKFESTIGLPYAPNPNHKINLSFYYGPNKFKLLKSEYGDKQLQELVTVGKSIIKWINQIIILKLFDFLSRFISNYGIIILILTLVIKLCLLPLTFKSYMSTAKMKVLKPQIDEINKKIPKDKAMERQQATMALYKKVGVSPLGGCLPMALQMPFLFAMFRFFPTSIELRQQSFLWATDLSTYDSILEWQSFIPFVDNSFGTHLSLFTVLMTVTTMLTMKFTNQSSMSNQQMPGMKGMMYVMPIMFMFILNKFSAGLTYYYFLSNLITLGQNLLFKQFIDEEQLLKKLESKKGKVKKKSKFQQRMVDLSKQQKGIKPKKK